MSEELPETADKAIRGFIALFLLGAVLEGWSAWHHDEFARALEYWGVGAMLATLGVLWVRLREWAGPRFTATATNVATDFRWWVGAVILILAFLTFSPFVEQQRWPFSAWVTSAPSPSADEIAAAVVKALPALKGGAGENATLQNQLAAAQAEAKTNAQDAATARAQLTEVQRQQQQAQSNQFIFPPIPIKKRKLIHTEAVGLIEELSRFTDLFRLLDQPMSASVIRPPARFGPPPPTLEQKREGFSDVSLKLKEFRTNLRQISSTPSFKAEIDEMLGGANWNIGNSLDITIQTLDSYSESIDKLLKRPSRPDEELIGYALRDPQERLSRAAEKFNSWRNGVSETRIQQLKNEARDDL